MGRLKKNNFIILVTLVKTSMPEVGADSPAEAFEKGESYAQAQGSPLLCVELWPQTTRAKKLCKKDFMIIDGEGNAQHFKKDDIIPEYTF